MIICFIVFSSIILVEYSISIILILFYLAENHYSRCLSTNNIGTIQLYKYYLLNSTNVTTSRGPRESFPVLVVRRFIHRTGLSS